MRRLLFGLAGLIGLFTLCSCAEDMAEDASPAPQPFVHDPLAYRVKVKYSVTFQYTPKDPDDAPEYVINAFERRLEADGNNGNGYQLAEGEAPNLNLNITVRCDTSDNKTMVVDGYVNDGYFHTYTDFSYQDSEKMINAMADEVNGYVAQGWHGTR